MSLESCPICGMFDTYALTFNRPHRCPPAWLVWPDDCGYDEDAAERIYAHDAEEAAEEFAAQREAGWGPVDFELDVVVARATKPEERERFTVYGEIAMHYRATAQAA